MSERPHRKKTKKTGGKPGDRSGGYRKKFSKKQGKKTSKKAGVRPGKRPPLRMFTTTLWDYPSQHYDDSLGNAMQGDKGYDGATPSWVIWQLLQRYTKPGDTVLDPMCGSGTTLDVCTDQDRKGLGFDLAPTRPEITRADARDLPVKDSSVRLFFVDPPYSTHIDYSDDPRCIGKLDAGEIPEQKGKSGPNAPPPQMGEAYYAAMEEVIAEADRVLKPGGHLAIYVSDSWRKRKRSGAPVFMSIGFELFAIARDYLEPVDIISVVRHNTKLSRGNWHKAAEEENFFLRGFNYLMIFTKA